MLLESAQKAYNAAAAIIPIVPLALQTTVRHFAGLDKLSEYHDYRALLTLALVRNFMNHRPFRSITETQELMNKRPPVKGRVWISTYESPLQPDNRIGEILWDLIREIDPHGAEFDEMTKNLFADGRVPYEVAAVEAEWTGYRAHVSSKDPLPDISEREKYEAMEEETTSPVTTLYFHGGAYYTLDPATHRETTKKLAKDTSGRVYSVRYRLAPQNAFPAALLDAIVSYLTLLYPPPGAFHKPIQPECIVFAGDSAGGNLSIVLMRAILELKRRNIQLPWYGELRSVPLPAGLALNSPWCDLGMTTADADMFHSGFDYLPPGFEGWTEAPKCDAWEVTEERSHIYCIQALLTNPLVSPIFADDWEGAPPVFVCCGWEILAPDIKCFVKKLHKSSVKVVFEEYEGMPHCFAMMVPGAGSAKCFDSWGGFISAAVKDPKAISSVGKVIKAKTVEEIPIDLDQVSP